MKLRIEGTGVGNAWLRDLQHRQRPPRGNDPGSVRGALGLSFQRMDAMLDRETRLEDRIRQKVKDQFGALAASKEEFHAKMRLVFGEGYDVRQADPAYDRAVEELRRKLEAE